MRVDSEAAYLLHARPWRETSLLIELLTANRGRIGLMARGARSPGRRGMRALLQPGQPLRVSWSGRGELPNLVRAEATVAAHPLIGDGLFSLLYVNELTMALLWRNEAVPECFVAYADCLAGLSDRGDAGWLLRRFEAALLSAVGVSLMDYGSALEEGAGIREPDGDAGFADSDDWFRIDASLGVVRCTARAPDRLPGAIFQALNDGSREPPKDWSSWRAATRRSLRASISQQLGGRRLASWAIGAGLRRS